MQNDNHQDLPASGPTGASASVHDTSSTTIGARVQAPAASTHAQAAAEAADRWVSEKRLPWLGVSKPELALIVITMIWGFTFLVVHTAMTVSGPLFFVGLRFLVAAAIGVLVFRRSMRGLTRHDVHAGAVIGFCILLGYGLQTYGLQTIGVSKSAFITAMYVPLVPVLQWIVFKRPPPLMGWVGAMLAFVGLVLLAGPEGGSISMSAGELATLLGALAIAGEVIFIGYFAGRVDVRRVTVMQLLIAGICAWTSMPLAGESIPAFSWVWLSAAVGMGTASILIQLTMNWAQKSVSPTRATVIYTGEPVWGGVAGHMAGERLPLMALVGGVMIVLGVLVGELKPVRWRRRARVHGAVSERSR